MKKNRFFFASLTSTLSLLPTSLPPVLCLFLLLSVPTYLPTYIAAYFPIDLHNSLPTLLPPPYHPAPSVNTLNPYQRHCVTCLTAPFIRNPSPGSQLSNVRRGIIRISLCLFVFLSVCVCKCIWFCTSLCLPKTIYLFGCVYIRFVCESCISPSSLCTIRFPHPPLSFSPTLLVSRFTLTGK